MNQSTVMLWATALLASGCGTGNGACSEVIPPGYVGMRADSDGLDGEVLEPGRHSCGHRCRLILLETEELLKTEKLSILCTDDLNIQIDVKTRSRLRVKDGKGIKEVLDKQGSQLVENVLAAEILYDVYVSPVVRAVARNQVSKFATTQIRENREAITKSITEAILRGVENTPVEITFAVTSNIDYPESITKARERAKQRELQIKEEKAKQEMALLKAKNRLKIAQQTKAARVAEAEGESAYNTILSKSLTPAYLQMRAIEAQKVLYENVQPGDKIIFSDGKAATVPLIMK